MPGWLEQLHCYKRILKPLGFPKPLLNSFLTIPRHLFMPKAVRHFSYIDTEVRYQQQHILSPLQEMTLLTALDIQPAQHVLEISSDIGFITAILHNHLKYFTSIQQPQNAKKLSRILASLQLPPLEHFKAATPRLLQNKTYDRIIMTGAALDQKTAFEIDM